VSPTIGRILHYRLTPKDAAAVNKRRDDWVNSSQAALETGAQAHWGNPVRAGEYYPVIVTKVWNPEMFNGQVLLDGTDTLWVTSVHQGVEPGTWCWPPREP
jgi:hypothetical protein